MNIGVLGNGFIIGVFVQTAKQHENYHLKALWGRNPEKIKDWENDFEYVTSDLDKILNDPEIDVIYVALPNSLHYEYTMKALKAGKHCLVEKPFAVKYEHAKEMIEYANEHNLLCTEAIHLRYNEGYHKIKEQVARLGDIKIVDCNFSQYSRRYDKFKNGIILPAFSKELAGGALLDLNVYNIHFVVGIFGSPKDVHYFPNVEQGIDTSGVLVLDYGHFKASLVASKDCWVQSYGIIQGDKGYVRTNDTVSRCAGYDVVINGSEKEVYEGDHAEFVGFDYEFEAFEKLYNEKDAATIAYYNEETLQVCEVLDKALKSANLNY